MSESTPPSSDDLIHRHQFYASLSKDISVSNRATEVIGNKLDILTASYSKISDIVKASETRNKTLITLAVLIWTLVGGSVGWYVQRSVASSDKFMERLELMEKKITSTESMVEQHRDLPDKVEAMKRSLSDVRRQVDEFEVKRK